MKYRIGSRKSALALTQSKWVQHKLEELGLYSEIVIIESEGDENRTLPLYELDPLVPGVFTKRLEDALLNNAIDLAVHSLKDLPTTQPEDLVVAAIPARVNPSDCLLVHEKVFKKGLNLPLPEGASVGTSSLRREALLMSQRPDLKVKPIRGNLPTRIRLVETGEVDAIVLALAGLERLKLDTKYLLRLELPQTEFVPAPAQGALGIEIRKDAPSRLIEGLWQLNDEGTATETRIERAILKGLFGGCTLPLGVLCRTEAKELRCRAFIGIAEDRKENKHNWKRYHYFDFSDAGEQELVEKAVKQLKGAMDG